MTVATAPVVPFVRSHGAPSDVELRRGAPFAPSPRQLEVIRTREPEVLLDGPKDCGKTRVALEVLRARAFKYPGSRHLLARKTRHSLTQSAMITLRDRVFSERDRNRIRFFGVTQEYRFPNGSVIVVAGLDDPNRLQSGEYDTAFIPEATELTLTDWEMVGGLLRNGQMPYAQLVGDCNPSYPSHWLNQRCHAGATRRIVFRHTDNPSITEARIARLAALTGIRRKRLYEGLWVAAEGSVYEDAWDPALNVVDRFEPRHTWRRWWVVDFGHTHPFVWQDWAEDEDGRLYLCREIYRTRRLVEDHARQILAITKGDPPPEAIICDHDAEDRATLERHLGMRTAAAWKPRGSVRIGIDAVATRMRPAGDGRPRLFVMRGATVERDPGLFGRSGEPLPASTEEEIEAYQWNPRRDEPLKENDHGCLVGETLVSTPDGERQLETIRAGDVVITRNGPRRVISAGMTSRSAEVMEVLFSNGVSLVGTPDHPVWVASLGWHRMDDLRQGMHVEVERCIQSSCHSTGGLRGGGSMGWSTVDIQVPRASLIAGTSELALGIVRRVGRFFTATTTRFIAARFLPGGMSTTSMETRSTTPLTTLSPYHQHSTTKITRISTARSGLRTSQACLRLLVGRCWTRPPSGIAVLRVARGTPPTLARSPRIALALSSSVRAPTAGNASSGMLTAHRASTVATDANPRPEGRRGSITRPASAPTAGRDSPSTGSSLLGTAAGGARVVRARRLEERQPVFNLAVDGEPEFFANGVLVHNCDAMRYIVAHIDRPDRRSMSAAPDAYDLDDPLHAGEWQDQREW